MTNKYKALKNYKEAKENYLQARTSDNWIKFCDAKRVCMLLGIRL